MSEPSEDAEQIRQLVADLSNQEPAVRKDSREKLIQIGGSDVARALVSTLVDPRTHVRWEAAKALQAIADPIAAPALMHAMEDEEQDIRWVAAQGLVDLGKLGLMTVLSGLIKRAGSPDFCQTAHHVLYHLQSTSDMVAPVLKALERSEPGVTAPPAAYDALVALSQPTDTDAS